MLDIPYLHNFNEKTAMNLMDQLGKTQNFSLFTSEIV